MALRRNAQELGLSQGALANDVEGYQGTVDRQEFQPDQPSTSDIALQGLLRIGQGLAIDKFEADIKTTYIKGQLARQQGTAVEAMDVDPIMRPFAHGGFNDEDARVKTAEFEQDYNRWLETEGRTLSPDDPKVKEFLTRGNTQVLDLVNNGGMSRNAEIAALAGQTQANAARVSKHYTAHRKYVVEEAVRRITPEGNVIISELSKAMLNNDTMTYDATKGQAVVYYQGIAKNSDLPVQLRQEISEKFVNALLAADQREPVEAMLDAGILDNLAFDKREKVIDNLRASKDRTKAKDFASEAEYFAAMEDAGIKGDIPLDEFVDFVEAGGSRKPPIYSPSRQIALLREATRNGTEKAETLGLLNAVNQGIEDGPEGVWQYGGPKAALEKVDSLLRKTGVPPTQRVVTMTKAGLRFGTFPAQYGESIGQALRAVGSAGKDDEVNPVYTDTLNTVTSIVSTAMQTEPNKGSALLTALPTDTQGAMSYILGQAAFGIEPVAALRTYLAKEAEVKSKTPAQLARTKQTWWDEHKGTIQDEGAFDTTWGGKFSADDVFSDVPIKDNVWAELNRLDTNQAYWGASEEDKVRIAVGNVYARTIPVPVKSGSSDVRPVILDPDVSMSKLFGSGADAVMVGKALAELAPPSLEDATSVVRWDKVNKTFVQDEQLPDGHFITTGTIAVEDVRAKVEAQQQQIIDANLARTLGVPTQTSAGTINIDGRNSQGEIKDVVQNARLLVNKAAPDMVSSFVTAGGNPQKAFREDTDTAVAATKRFVSPHYTHPKARASVIAAVYVEGADKVQTVIEAADAAIAEGDFEAYQEALSMISNPVVKQQLQETIPIASPDNFKSTFGNSSRWQGISN